MWANGFPICPLKKESEWAESDVFAEVACVRLSYEMGSRRRKAVLVVQPHWTFIWIEMKQQRQQWRKRHKQKRFSLAQLVLHLKKLSSKYNLCCWFVFQICLDIMLPPSIPFAIFNEKSSPLAVKLQNTSVHSTLPLKLYPKLFSSCVRKCIVFVCLACTGRSKPSNQQEHRRKKKTVPDDGQWQSF